MDAQSIRQALGELPGGRAGEIAFYPAIDSTNAEAIRRLRQGELADCLLVAATQHAGRGRRGRTWLSPAGQGIYLSLVRRFPGAPDRLQSLSLLTALSVHKGITALGGNNLRLKWPNDIYHNNRKLAGILLELHREIDSCHLVFGIGVNLSLDDQARQQIDQPVTDLATVLGHVPGPESVIAAIVQQLLPILDEFDALGFAPFRDIWNSLDYFAGQQVRLANGRQNLEGRSLGVDEHGALQLETDSGIERINGGEIQPSLRPLQARTS